jgi:hypothetical protein
VSFLAFVQDQLDYDGYGSYVSKEIRDIAAGIASVHAYALGYIPHPLHNFALHVTAPTTTTPYPQAKEFARSSTGEPNRPGNSILDAAVEGLRRGGCVRYIALDSRRGE